MLTSIKRKQNLMERESLWSRETCFSRNTFSILYSWLKYWVKILIWEAVVSELLLSYNWILWGMLNANLLMDTTHLLPVHFHYLVVCTDHQPADCRLNHNCQAHVWWLMSQSTLKLLMIQHTPTLQNLFIEDRTNFLGLKHLLYNGLELSSCIPTKVAELYFQN